MSHSGFGQLQAYGVNDVGQNVGDGMYNGQITAFLMTPDGVDAPEPGTLAIWGIMGIAVGLCLVRSKPRS